jgi:aryl-alcohol dehydrogenase-like predicted oxidoreductase
MMRAFDDLVRAGKVLYAGISDTPAWQIAHMQTLADLRGWAPLVALQIEYSLIERTGYRELLPMAQELGLGALAWSPLGNGVLTAKYTRADLDHSSVAEVAGSRKNVAAGSGALAERTLGIVEVKEIAREAGRSPAQIALAWTLRRRAPLVMPIIGARTLAQLPKITSARSTWCSRTIKSDSSTRPAQYRRASRTSSLRGRWCSRRSGAAFRRGGPKPGLSLG